MAATAPGIPVTRREPPAEISCEALRFDRGRQRVLDVPALRFAPGAVTALVGPNGAGKTTLLRLVAALEKPTAGRVLLRGEPVTRKRAQREVAYGFQSPVFVSGTVRANVELALQLRGFAREERQVRIEEAARACGIGALLDRDVRRLSGGEAQRANLARALALRAPVTLLDEPLSGLDGPARRQLLHELPGLLREFAGTTILVTHDRDEALRLAEELVVLIDGRVHATGNRAQVFAAPPDAATARFLGFTLIPSEGALIAVAPHALRPGEPGGADIGFEMDVAEVLDLGVRREAWGQINGADVSVPLPPELPTAPGRLRVSAPKGAVTHFTGEKSQYP